MLDTAHSCGDSATCGWAGGRLQCVGEQGGNHGAAPVGNVADAAVGQRVANTASASVMLDQAQASTRERSGEVLPLAACILVLNREE